MALRTGYARALEQGLDCVFTLDSDGQHRLAAVSGGLVLAPNPAGGRVRISAVGRAALAPGQVTVYSVRGERVRTLDGGPSGTTEWDLRDQGGQPVPAGVYFVAAGDQVTATRRQRLVVVR